jgi:tetratricopeptide (TPR) repeat protein
MKIRLTLFALLFTSPAVLAQWKPPELMPGMGSLHHPIATANVDAQRYFDQGLTFVYAYNHEEAIRDFRHAAELDPTSPMPWWGVALAAGQSYNETHTDPAREKSAYEAILRAKQLAADGPANERAYVEALAQRYSNDPSADLEKLAVKYRDAMRDLAARYPDDLDAATLYAESIMVLHPWKLWSSDGRPAEGTGDAIAVLESVLRRDPNHVGANHYYIHALEASPHPERALPSAERLGIVVPAAGHLVHMPAHIYERAGFYDLARTANERGVADDRDYIQHTGASGGMYDMHYLSHNLLFLAQACIMTNNYDCAHQAADQLASHVSQEVKQMSMLEYFLPMQFYVLARFSRWNEILAAPAPDATLLIDSAIWHFARGLAFVGKNDLSKASGERQALAAIISGLPGGTRLGLNTAAQVLNLALTSLDARILEAKGDRDAAIRDWKIAVGVQDALNYAEPPDWYYPVRESLGGAFLRSGNFAAAELIFRDDLQHYPRNPRSLFGLWQSLKAQNKSVEAELVHQQFDAAWKHADVSLEIGDL